METASAAIAVPPGFDPMKPWPVLVVSATSDGAASSVRMMGAFAKTATELGWVVIAADGPNGAPPNDSTDFRWAMLSAVLRQMKTEWPGSEKWHYATAGFSGGGKRSGYLAALLAKSGYPLVGIFMGGVNEDTPSDALRGYHPPASFKQTPIFLSGGTKDRTAKPKQQQQVAATLKTSGFRNLRYETYDGGHKLDKQALAAALKWFAAPAPL